MPRKTNALSEQNRKARTRKDLLRAATTLLRAGRTPTMDEVAEEALVSRATAYRYFSNVEELLIEAPVDTAVPEAKDLFGDKAELDAEERLDQAEAAMHESTYANETQLRLLLSQNLIRGSGATTVPIRQNRRSEYIKQALKPFRKDFNEESYAKLTASLALIFGTESMIVFRDVLPLSPARARKVKSWALRALVRTALAESQKSKRKR